MNTNQPLKKMIVGALLSGGVALAGLGLTAGTANAAPANPGPTIDHSDFGVPVVECIQCQRTLPGDGSVRVQPWTPVGRRLDTRGRPLRRPLTAQEHSSARHRIAGGGPNLHGLLLSAA